MDCRDQKVDIKQIRKNSSYAAIKQYALLVVGDTSLIRLLVYEFLIFLFSDLTGAAGLFLRRVFYRYIFAEMGKNVTIGRHVTIRGGRRLSIGDNVMIDDNCVLDARGEQTKIIIGAGTLLSGNTVVRARNAKISIGSGCSIGRNCLLGTDSRLEIEEEVLLGAYTYLCAGGLHRFDGAEVSVLAQGVNDSKGIFISKGAWLGTRTTVLDGVIIGKGTVVGAHSLVNKSLPDMVIAHGSPAKVTRKREHHG